MPDEVREGVRLVTVAVAAASAVACLPVLLLGVGWRLGATGSLVAVFLAVPPVFVVAMLVVRLFTPPEAPAAGPPDGRIPLEVLGQTEADRRLAILLMDVYAAETER